MFGSVNALQYDPARAFAGRADGKMRFEFSDHDSWVTGVLEDPTLMEDADCYIGQLGSVFNHPTFEANYPQLMNTRVQITYTNDTESGALMPTTMGSSLIELTFRWDSTAHHRRSVILHECQHAVQEVEDMSRGSCPAVEFMRLLSRQTIRMHDKLIASELELTDKRRFEWQDRIYKLGERDRYIGNGKIGDIPATDLRATRLSRVAYGRYMNTPGELEARCVEARADFTPEQRRRIFPQHILTPNW